MSYEIEGSSRPINEHLLNAALGRITGRDEGSYRTLFSADTNELVLDLGSGKTQFDTLPHVVQFDCAYTEPEARPKRPQQAVAGIYQQLPFIDNAFDRTTCRYGNLTPSVQGACEAVAEALRVTRPGGTIQIYPIYASLHNRRFIHDLQNDGYSVRFGSPWAAVRAELSDTAAKPYAKVLAALASLAFFRPLTIEKTEVLDGDSRLEFAYRIGPLVSSLSRTI
jgi:hypothetical protein